MSEFIHRTKIAALEQSNFELLDEISTLENQINDLVIQLEQLRRENPDEVTHLKEIIAEQEQREIEKKEQLSSASPKEQHHTQYNDAEQLLSSLEMTDGSIVETAMTLYHKKQSSPKLLVAFLFGITVSLAVWFISEYFKNDLHFNAILKQALDTVSK